MGIGMDWAARRPFGDGSVRVRKNFTGWQKARILRASKKNFNNSSLSISHRIWSASFKKFIDFSPRLFSVKKKLLGGRDKSFLLTIVIGDGLN